MRVVVLSDNRTEKEAFETEHGLSVYVETKRYRYLLDTGASSVFIRNASLAGVDLTKVDYVIISHGHRDHAGGLEAFLLMNHQAKVIVAEGALNQPFYSQRMGMRSIGTSLDTSLYTDRIIEVNDFCRVNNETIVFRAIQSGFPLPAGNKTLYKEVEGELMADDFSHERVVVIGNEHPFVFTGCAHRGVQNILESLQQHQVKQLIQSGEIIKFQESLTQDQFQPAVVFGGFHLVENAEGKPYETVSQLDAIANYLMSNFPETQFFTGHCTGDKACLHLESQLQGRLKIFGTGNEYHF